MKHISQKSEEEKCQQKLIHHKKIIFFNIKNNVIKLTVFYTILD